MYVIEKHQIAIPDDYSEDTFLGKVRYRFKLDGYDAWLVVPHNPIPGKYWFAVPEWPTAFPDRNGVNALLDMGFYMVHVNLLGLYACDEAVAVMHKYYNMLQENGFRKKGAFIGMSLGGLYSFRYANAHPEGVSCIYADAPVCDLTYKTTEELTAKRYAAYHTDSDEVLKKASPINNLENIAKADIPILMLLGFADNVIDPLTHGMILLERFTALGGRSELVKRQLYGHHPHGMDNPGRILGFIMQHTMNK